MLTRRQFLKFCASLVKKPKFDSKMMPGIVYMKEDLHIFGRYVAVKDGFLAPLHVLHDAPRFIDPFYSTIANGKVKNSFADLSYGVLDRKVESNSLSQLDSVPGMPVYRARYGNFSNLVEQVKKLVYEGRKIDWKKTEPYFEKVLYLPYSENLFCIRSKSRLGESGDPVYDFQGGLSGIVLSINKDITFCANKNYIDGALQNLYKTVASPIHYLAGIENA